MYSIPQSIKDAVLAATCAGDVDVGTRNKLYRAIARMLERPDVSPEVIAKWSEDSLKQDTKFAFLKSFVADPTCATMEVSETHERSKTTYSDNQMAWATKWQIYQWYGAYHNPEAKVFCDELIAKAKKRPSQDQPGANGRGDNPWREWVG